jgi:mycofactocin system FadH/OYE family oxidoreductase 2
VQKQFEYLFSPMRLRNSIVRNRIYNPPHATIFADENFLPTEKQVYYYAERAKGGTGLIVMGGSVVLPNSLVHIGFNLVSDERAIPGYRRIADAVHAHGSLMMAQLSHHGRQTTSLFSRSIPTSPSPIPCLLYHEMPKEIDDEDMEEILKAFIKGAQNVEAAGFDGVEIYAAHGYLLSQFLSPHTNRRRDQYGGNLENRMRFPIQVIEAVREATGKNFIIGLRMNGDDFTPGGLTLDDARIIAKKFEETGKIDFLSISGATYNSLPLFIADMSFPLGLFVHLAAGIKEVVNLPVFCVNRINDPIQAERILAGGYADMVGMCRALICDPELPNKAQEGRIEDIQNCIACNECATRESKNARISCTQNPAVGEEKEFGIGTLTRSPKRKKVLVIGGGPSGMEAARVAALRGHQVTLYEKEKDLGGQIRIIIRVSSRKEFEGVTRYLMKQLEKLNVDIKTNMEATIDTTLAENPDCVVVATGSVPLRTGFTPFRPEIDELPGVHQSNVITYWDALLDTADVGERVVVLDDNFYFQTTTTAEYLAERGKQVEIITRAPMIGADINFLSLGPQCQRLRERGVLFSPMTWVKEISGTTVFAYDVYSKQERRVRADTVVLSMGNQSENSLYKNLKGKVKEIFAVGDCVTPRKAIDAIYEGHRVGRLL